MLLVDGIDDLYVFEKRSCDQSSLKNSLGNDIMSGTSNEARHLPLAVPTDYHTLSAIEKATSWPTYLFHPRGDEEQTQIGLLRC